MKKILLIIFPLFLFSSEAKIALDYAKIEQLFANLHKCSNNDFSGCINKIDNIYNIQEAKSYINERCKEQEMAACYFIFDLAKDEYTKYNALRLACQNGFELACTKAIAIFETNQTKALRILKHQCDNEKNINSCHASAEFLALFQDKENAIKYAEKACKNDFYNSCILQAKLYFELDEKKKTFDILEQTCNEKYEEACFLAANYYLNIGNYKTSRKFLEKSCNLGNKLSCKKLTSF